MKKSILMFSAACLLIVASCKKDNKTDDQAGDCLLTESVRTEPEENPERSFFTYDAEGRLTKLKYTVDNENEDYEIKYTYFSSSIGVIDKSNYGSDTTIYNLDPYGRIASESYGGRQIKRYIYNTEGYMVETQKSYDEGSYREITKYNYTNGNLTSIDYSDGYTESYIYGTELAKDNFVSEMGFVFDRGLRKFYGKTSRNLVSKFIEGYGAATRFEETYTYEKDAKGNITKVRALSNDGDSYVLSSKYNCK